jgi:glycosyl hydrolase family 26
MAVNGLVVAGFAGWILMPSAIAPAPENRIAPAPPITAVTELPQPPTREQILELEGLRFGISAPEVPWSSRHFDRLASSASASPTMIQAFVNWTQDYPSETVELSYRRGALPVLSWEPWAGGDGGADQPEYALHRIIDGEFDPYIRGFAVAMREHGWPVAIRFAHEMNGYWFPWSEQTSGNRPGEYLAAWRHVHDLFEDLDVDNAIWLWSPNILRPVPSIDLRALYPGDDYVDWIGMVGYAVEESTAAAVFGPTLDALREFTDKSLVITETGAQPGERKAPWIEDFFDWLAEHPDVIGFIWFEYDTHEGGNADWRFTATPESMAAFREGLTSSQLAPPPLAPPG